MGQTNSVNYPTTLNALQGQRNGPSDAFISHLRYGGLLASTYFGGSSTDGARGVAVDPRENVYLAGGTISSDFPVYLSLQAQSGGDSDAFVTKVNEDVSQLLYSTYLGRAGSDSDGKIAVDALGSAAVTGSTTSTDFPTTPGAFQTVLSGTQDAFGTQLTPAGDALSFFTYLAGTDFEYGSAIAVDHDGGSSAAG